MFRKKKPPRSQTKISLLFTQKYFPMISIHYGCRLLFNLLERDELFCDCFIQCSVPSGLALIETLWKQFNSLLLVWIQLKTNRNRVRILSKFTTEIKHPRYTVKLIFLPRLKIRPDNEQKKKHSNAYCK